MRADNSNGIFSCNLEDFAQMLLKTNANLAYQKLSAYGLINERVMVREIREIPLIEKSKDVLLGDKEAEMKYPCEERKKKIMKNPFKQKLKLQLGL
jgi:hypothetical protein